MKDERESERERERLPAVRMFVARRIGGKGRRAVLGWSPRHLSWKWWRGEEKP